MNPIMLAGTRMKRFWTDCPEIAADEIRCPNCVCFFHLFKAGGAFFRQIAINHCFVSDTLGKLCKLWPVDCCRIMMPPSWCRDGLLSLQVDQTKCLLQIFLCDCLWLISMGYASVFQRLLSNATAHEAQSNVNVIGVHLLCSLLCSTVERECS